MWHVRPAKPQTSLCAYAQSDQSLCSSLDYSISVKLLTEHLLEVLSLKGGCTCSSESTLVKIPHCWKSLVVALNRGMRFPTIWYVQPAKAQTSLHIHSI